MEKLFIAEQTCLLEEKFSKNGVQKNVHVVVKNNPFVITLALLDKQINFNQVSTDIQLVYDCASLKEVDFVKLKPMDFKLKPNEEGDQLTIELRIKVLTSQLEDMFFRVKIALVDPRTQKEIPHFMVLSHPIRVVSKPDQVKKKIKKRKRAPTDNLMDTLTRIEVQQKEQQRLLKKLCVVPACAYVPGIANIHGENVPDTTDGFHSAFMEFLSAFKQLSSMDDNAYKVNTNAQDAQTMCEILDLIRAELKRAGHYCPSTEDTPPPPHPAAAAVMPSASALVPLLQPHTCACDNCPYRDKVDRLDKVSLELFSAIPPDGPIDKSQHQCMNAMTESMVPIASYPFAPFSDFNTLFAAQ